MIHRSGDGRIAVVVWPLDRGLTLLRGVLVALFAVLVSVSLLRTLTGSLKGAPTTWLVAAGIVAVIFILVTQTEVVREPVDRTIARVRRRVAMACNHDEGGLHDDGRIACLLTPEMLQAPLFEYVQQREAVRRLKEACGDDRRGEYWFLEGESGSGKTRTALRFVQTLARDRELCELAGRCFLFDFSGTTASQRKLLKSFTSTRHDRSVVLVDNFQRVEGTVLDALTQRLTGDSDGPHQLLVFLTRPGEAGKQGPGSDVRLLSEAKAVGHHLRLGGPSSETVAQRVYACDADAARLIRELGAIDDTSAAQLHLAQVIVRNGAAPPEVLALLRLLIRSRGTPAPDDDDDLHTLAVVTGLAMHRGTFSRRDVRRAVRAVGPASGAARSLSTQWRSWRTFRRFHAMGLVPKLRLDGTRYVFHEAIAELCIDRLAAHPAFQASLEAVGRLRMRDRSSEENVLDRWLTAVEIGEQETLQATFDSALSSGAYNRMTRCLTRASRRYKLTKSTRLQLAILLNRTGRFKESRAEFNAELLDALRSSDELTAMLATSRMEATHEPEAEAGLEVLCRHSDRFVAIVGEYWKVHMAAHRGSFDSVRLLELATEAFALMGERESYWRTYSLARMHFDSLRHHHLEGRSAAELSSPSVRGHIGDFLGRHLMTYKALDTLYTKAHVVGHILLPKKAIFHEDVTPDEQQHILLPDEWAESVDGLVTAARYLYQRSSDEFWKYGDREAVYLKADLMNAGMIDRNARLDTFEGALDEYQRLFVAADYPSIASYPHFYFLRWNMLKHYAAPHTQDGLGAPAAMDHHLAAAQRHLSCIFKLDTAAGNTYGLMRARLLAALLHAVLHPLDECGLPALAQEMAGRGYGRETRLLNYLIGKQAIEQTELRAIFRFYPFVHQ